MIARYSLSVLVAVCITFGLFYVMQYLVRITDPQLDKAATGNIIDFVRLKRDERVEEKERKLPEKVEKEDTPPPPPDINMQNMRPDQGGMKVGMDFGGGGLDIQGGVNLGSAPSDGDVLPLVRIAPQYPQGAQSRGIEGYVDFRFTISRTGTVLDPVVIDAQPKGVFERAAERALLRWKYKPKIENGEPVERPGVEVRIRFDLAN